MWVWEIGCAGVNESVRERGGVSGSENVGERGWVSVWECVCVRETERMSAGVRMWEREGGR